MHRHDFSMHRHAFTLNSIIDTIVYYLQVPIQVIFINGVSDSPPVYITVFICNQPVQMELDTGAGVSIISFKLYSTLFKHIALSQVFVSLNSYSGPIKVYGQIIVDVVYSNSLPIKLPLLVCEASQHVRSLFGRPWLDILMPDWRNAFNVPVRSLACKPDHVTQFRVMFPNIFDLANDNPIRHFKATLLLKENVQNVFARAYSLPYALIDTVEDLIVNLLSQNKIFQVSHSDNASPCLPVKKKSGGYRLCVDFKRTLNKQLHVNQYPLPVIEDIFASLANAVIFTTIDLSDAYTQLELNDASKPFVTANTHKGLYRFNRLIYGISSAPAIFQQVMDCILKGISGVTCYLDDILIHGSSFDECHSRTVLVLTKLSEYNVKINSCKSQWFVNQVEHLGWHLSKDGRKPSSEKISAVSKAMVPKTKKQIDSFLGLFTYYHQFLPNFSAVSKPLRDLNDPIVWTDKCQSAYDSCKKLFVSSGVLIHYNPKLQIIVACDASPYGLGAILSHKFELNGVVVERPVIFASCSLTDCQQRYAQIDREALAIMFAISRFHKYIWGRKFILQTDNAPLRHILCPDKPIPVMAAQRLQHWAYALQAYQFEIVHKQGSALLHVDALSRVPSPQTFVSESDLQSHFVDVLSISSIPSDLPLNVSVIREESKKDPVLSKVILQTQLGWPHLDKYLEDVLKPFFKLSSQLSIEKGCLLYMSRVVIPASLQSKVLEILHEGHAGIVRMKLLARTSVWWPNISKDIETKCQFCSSCSVVNFKRSHDYVPWPEAKSPFERIHVDFYTFEQNQYFIIADSFSKWLHVQRLVNTRACDVISVLETVFSIFGDPAKIVSDNGPPFDAIDYVDFCTSRDIIVLYSPEYHPESNGYGERSVFIAKGSVGKLALDARKASNIPENEFLSTAECDKIVTKFLFTYRNTPTTTTLVSPNQMLLSYQPRTNLSRLLPSISCNPPSNLPYRDGQSVLVKLHKRSPPVRGTVVRCLGPTRYLVSFQGVLRKPHVNQMRHAPAILKCFNLCACTI